MVIDVLCGSTSDPVKCIVACCFRDELTQESGLLSIVFCQIQAPVSHQEHRRKKFENEWQCGNGNTNEEVSQSIKDMCTMCVQSQNSIRPQIRSRWSHSGFKMSSV